MSDNDEIQLMGSKDSVALNAGDTIAVFAYDHTKNNQTRTTTFTPELLLEWAKRVNEAYGDDPAVELVFTPDKPLIARKQTTDKEPSIGIGLAPRLLNHGDDE